MMVTGIFAEDAGTSSGHSSSESESSMTSDIRQTIGYNTAMYYLWDSVHTCILSLTTCGCALKRYRVVVRTSRH